MTIHRSDKFQKIFSVAFIKVSDLCQAVIYFLQFAVRKMLRHTFDRLLLMPERKHSGSNDIKTYQMKQRRGVVPSGYS